MKKNQKIIYSVLGNATINLIIYSSKMPTHRKIFYTDFNPVKKQWVIKNAINKTTLYSFNTENEAKIFKKRLEKFPMK